MKTETKTFIEVDYYDLDREVSEAFGRSFKFVADQEANNDAFYHFAIDGAANTSVYDQNKIAEFKTTGRGTFLTQLLMNELCAMGKITAGDYLVKVFW